MNKRVLAILLAITMIASSCVLFASAVDAQEKIAKDKYVTDEGYLVHDVSITAKKAPKVGSASTVVDENNIDDLVDIKIDSTTASYGEIAAYIEIYGSISFASNGVGTANLTIKGTEDNKSRPYYKASEEINEGIAIEDKASLQTGTKRHYNFEKTSLTVTNIKQEIKLCKVTTGVHFYGKSTNNLVASEIAVVKATVVRDGGILKSYNIGSSAYDVIYDLLPDDVVTLTTELKNKEDAGFYGFNCWIDGSNVVMKSDEGKPNQITFKMDGKDATVYANYVELVPRFRIDYEIGEHGKMVVFKEGTKETKTRAVFQGDDQISVLQDKDFTFTFIPDEGYEVSKVIIDGTTNVASFKYLLTSEDGFLAAVKQLVAATGSTRAIADKAVSEGTYTFKKVDKDHTIYVEFMKKEPLEAPSGMELPTITAERDELATGAADAANATNADGSAAAAGSVTTLPAENGAAAGSAAAVGGVVNPATGSGSAIAVFAVMTAAAAAAFVTMKKKED